MKINFTNQIIINNYKESSRIDLLFHFFVCFELVYDIFLTVYYLVTFFIYTIYF